MYLIQDTEEVQEKSNEWKWVLNIQKQEYFVAVLFVCLFCEGQKRY